MATNNSKLMGKNKEEEEVGNAVGILVQMGSN
jgi:hypothetical protein